MTPITEHILVATDFSTPSKRAARVVSQLASSVRPRPTITLFNAVAPLPLGRMSPFVPFGTKEEDLEADLRGRARDQLRETRQECFGEEPVRIAEEKHSHPAFAICEAAERLGADLVAIGTHGLTGLKRAVFGSVAARVLRHAETNVLCVPGELDAKASTPRKVVAATDFSRSAQRAVMTAARWALAFDVPLELLHVISLTPVHQAGFGWVFPTDLAGHAKVMTEQAEEHMATFRDQRLRHVPEVTMRAVVGTAAAERSITDHVTETQASLVVIGSVGRTGMKRLLLGSVAEGVARHSPVPVLCVRSEGA